MFKIVFPFESTIYGDSFKTAVKNFIKLNHNFNITKLIIQDQQNRIEANLNYYKEDGRNKVGINMFPVGLEYPVPIVTNDTYIPPRVVDPVLVPNIFPVSPLPISPMSLPFIPTVINIPNV